MTEPVISLGVDHDQGQVQNEGKRKWKTPMGDYGSKLIERFSNECRKTKTKVITLTNHDKNKTQNEPIRNRS